MPESSAITQMKQWICTIARIALGIDFILHGYQKIVSHGIDITIASFSSMNVPYPTFSAWFAIIVELVGGILLVIGLAVPLASFFLIIDMIGAIITVHFAKGFFNPGWEFPLMYIIALLVIAVADYGAYGLDKIVINRSKAQISKST